MGKERIDQGKPSSSIDRSVPVKPVIELGQLPQTTIGPGGYYYDESGQIRVELVEKARQISRGQY